MFSLAIRDVNYPCASNPSLKILVIFSMHLQRSSWPMVLKMFLVSIYCCYLVRWHDDSSSRVKCDFTGFFAKTPS